MASTKIGSFIEEFSQRCGIPNLSLNDVSGINIEKEFFSPSKQKGKDTSGYKIVPPGYFACNLMHVGRDKLLPVARNKTSKNIIVSPAYTVFFITKPSDVCDVWFELYLQQKGFNRYCWFKTDSSIRGNLPWETFKNISINLPDLDTQRRFVQLYESLNSTSENMQGLSDFLKTMTELEIEKVKNIDQRPLQNLVKIVDENNPDSLALPFLGLNIKKEFMKTVADTSDVSIDKYKILRKGYFVFSGMQTGRDQTVRIGLYKKDSPALVSPA